jgi:hypothetical protein
MNWSRKGKIRNSIEKTRSGFEDTILCELQDAGIPYEYEPMDSHIGYTTQRKYIPDLKITRKDGHVIFVEIKGFFTTDDMSKMIAVKACNPKTDIRFLFQNSKSAVQGARIRKKCGTKMSCGEWADLHNFDYANKHLPESWLDVPTS